MVIVPVILAGGVGERFWPMSRSSMPKQLLKIISSKTMTEETLSRTDKFISKGVKPIIVTGKAIAPKFKEIIPAKVKYDLIAEPVGKNTAPAIALAASWIESRYGEAVMVVLSADHEVHPKDAFTNAVRFGIELADQLNQLIVFGIRPKRPETGYGYIELGKQIQSQDSISGYSVKRFVEKPDQKKAASFLESGKYMWNSGMFVWKTSVILEEFRQYMPELYKLTQKAAKMKFTGKAVDQFYLSCEKESIDYGIMEQSKRVSVVIGEFDWDDIGSWESVGRLHGINKNGTTVMGKNVFEKDCDNSIVVNSSKHSIASIGLKDCVVVATEDALLVMDRAKLPEIKKYLSEMRLSGVLPKNLF